MSYLHNSILHESLLEFKLSRYTYINIIFKDKILYRAQLRRKDIPDKNHAFIDITQSINKNKILKRKLVRLIPRNLN